MYFPKQQVWNEVCKTFMAGGSIDINLQFKLSAFALQKLELEKLVTKNPKSPRIYSCHIFTILFLWVSNFVCIVYGTIK